MSTVLVKNKTELIDLCDPVVVMERTEQTGGGSTDSQGYSVGPQTGREAVWVHRQAVWVQKGSL